MLPTDFADFIDTTRAKLNIPAPSGGFTSDQNTLIAAQITAASRAIATYCQRPFSSHSYDELYNGQQHNKLVLREFPILSIQRVVWGPTVVISITNTTASNLRATVSVTATGLSLVRVAAGVSHTDTINFSDQVTIGNLAAAVIALGNGWTATVPSDFTNWASADLRALYGPLSAAKGATADLVIHVNELSDYEIDAERGWLYRRTKMDLVGWDLSTWDGFNAIWHGGPNYWRIIYTAGYATVPAEIQEATAQWVSVMFNIAQRDPTTGNSFRPQDTGSVGNSFAITTFEQMPGSVKALIEPYRKRRLLTP